MNRPSQQQYLPARRLYRIGSAPECSILLIVLSHCTIRQSNLRFVQGPVLASRSRVDG